MRIQVALTAAALTLAPLGLRSAAAQAPAAPESPPVILEKIKLAHIDSRTLLALLAGGSTAAVRRKEVRGISGDKVGATLLPTGIDGVLGFELDNSLIVRGTPASVQALKRGIRVGDVKLERPAKSRALITVTPARLKPEHLREQVLKLPNAGTATVQGERLTLDGSPAWMDEALRLVLRGEMGEP